MPQGTTKHARVGTRVQVPAYLDIWMRGARYGTVARVRDNIGAAVLYGVRMDNTRVKRLVWCVAEDCQHV